MICLYAWTHSPSPVHSHSANGIFVVFSSDQLLPCTQDQAEYDTSRCHAFVCDISDEEARYPMEDGSLDVVTVIFVLSALQPCKYVHSCYPT